MATDQTVLYIIILVAIALVLLLIGVVLAYLRIVKRYLDLKEGKIEEVDPRIIIKQEQEKSQRILEDAQFQAHQVITKAQAFLATNESVLSKELEITTQDYAKKYEGNLEIVQKNIIKILENIPEDSKKMLLAEISNIKKSLAEEIGKAATEAKAAVTEAYKKAEDEVVIYKNERLRQADESIIFILKQVARKVLAKEISQDEHEKLVLKALEEAKRQGIFGAKSS